MSVTVKPNMQGDDIKNAILIIDGRRFEIPFSMDSRAIENMIDAECGVTLDTDEIMSITYMSREQVEREGERVLERLRQMAPGTVAVLGESSHGWINPHFPNELTISEQLTVSGANAKYIGMLVSDIGAIDTEELYAIAEEFRGWLKESKTLVVDPDWLASVS